MCWWQALQKNWSPDAAMYPVTSLESIRALLMWPYPTGDGETFSGSLQPQASRIWTIDAMKVTQLVHSVPSFLGISCNFCIQNGNRVSQKPQGTAQVFGLVLVVGQALSKRWQSPCPSHCHHPRDSIATQRGYRMVSIVSLHVFSRIKASTLLYHLHFNDISDGRATWIREPLNMPRSKPQEIQPLKHREIERERGMRMDAKVWGFWLVHRWFSWRSHSSA